MNWLQHSDAFVLLGGFFEIEFRESSETEWRQSFTVNGNQTSADIVTTAVNTQYDLRIRAVNAIGSKSNWSTIYNAIAGNSGGVGSTDDWGDWTSSPSTTEDWGDWTSSPSTTEDWGYFS